MLGLLAQVAFLQLPFIVVVYQTENQVRVLAPTRLTEKFR